MSEATQDVRINGKVMALPTPITVAGLLDRLGVDRKHVAVEQNRKIVSKAAYATTPVEADDEFEVVTFVGGG